MIKEHRQKIEDIFGPGVLGRGNDWPSVRLDALIDDGKRTALKSVILSLMKATEASNPPLNDKYN